MNGQEKKPDLAASTEEPLKVLEWKKDHQKSSGPGREALEQGQEEWKSREFRASIVVQ